MAGQCKGCFIENVFLSYFYSKNDHNSELKEITSPENKEADGPWCLLENQLGYWSKFQKLHIYFLCTPGVEIELIFALQAAVWYIWAYFQNCPTLNLANGKNSRSSTYTRYSFSTQGIELELIFALQAAVSEIEADCQNWHIWAWNLATGQSSRSWTYTGTLFLPPGGWN